MATPSGLFVTWGTWRSDARRRGQFSSPQPSSASSGKHVHSRDSAGAQGERVDGRNNGSSRRDAEISKGLLLAAPFEIEAAEAVQMLAAHRAVFREPPRGIPLRYERRREEEGWKGWQTTRTRMDEVKKKGWTMNE
ncbi:hypothetical protein MRX96_004900 [Rhipicephalus microplus]